MTKRERGLSTSDSQASPEQQGPLGQDAKIERIEKDLLETRRDIVRVEKEIMEEIGSARESTEQNLERLRQALGIATPLETPHRINLLVDAGEKASARLESGKDALEQAHEKIKAGQVIGACRETVAVTLQLQRLPREKKAILEKFLRKLEACGDVFSEVDAEKIAIATVGLLDVVIVDNIKNSAEETPRELAGMQSGYLRDKGREAIYGTTSMEKDGKEIHAWQRFVCMPTEEESSIEDRLQRHLKIIGREGSGLKTETCSDKEALLRDLDSSSGQKFYYLNSPLSPEEVLVLEEEIGKKDILGGVMVVAKVRLGDKMGGFYVYKRGNVSKAEDVERSLEQPEDNKSIVPLQDRWLAFLSKGFIPDVVHEPDKAIFRRAADSELVKISKAENPVSEDLQVENLLSEALEGQKLRRSEEYAVRKMEAITGDISPEALDRYKKRHQEHYAKLFERSGKLPNVVVTRGGFSANEVAINTVVDSIPKEQRKAYIVEGFYYENLMQVHRKFNQVPDLKDANILLVNSTPNGYAGLELSENYVQEREKTIAQFIKNASEHPDVPYSMVVDKTTDLLYESFQDKKSLPPNITVFETASITKHQRGGKNYFYGVVAQWGNSEQAEAMEKQVAPSRAELTPLAVVNMPRLRKSEIRKNAEHLQEVESNFTEAFERAQSDLPPELRWKIQSNSSLCALLVPPFEGLLEKGKNASDIRGVIGQEVYAVKNQDFLQSLADQKIVPGDSFGLEETRFTPITQPLPSQDAKKGLSGEFVFPRISFGSKTTPEEARKMGDWWAKYLISGFPPEWSGKAEDRNN